MLIRSFLAAMVLAAATGATAAEVDTVRGEAGNTLHEYLSRLEPFGFSGAIAVVDDGRLILSAGYGHADRSSGEPVTADTVFPLGRLTEAFTAAAVLKLHEAGKLSLRTPVGEFFDEWPDDKQAMRVHHLLTHTAGFPPRLQNPRYQGDPAFEPLARHNLIRRIREARLVSEPGVRYRHSPLGYNLLGAIIEVVSDNTYERWLRNKVLLPAGMKDTGYVLPEWRANRLAKGYLRGRDWGTLRDKPFGEDGPWWNLRAAGGLMSSATDMLAWLEVVRGNEVLAESARQEWLTGRVRFDRNDYAALGWEVRQLDDGVRLQQLGSDGPFSAGFTWYPAKRRLVFGATNSSLYRHEEILPRIETLLAGAGVEAPPAIAVKRNRPVPDRATGEWRTPSGAALAVHRDGPRLYLEATGQTAVDALAYPGEASPGYRGNRNARAEALVAALADGNREELTRQLADVRDSGRMAEHLLDWWKEREAGYGAVRSVRVLGTAPIHGERGTDGTWLEMTHVRSRRTVRLDWNADGTLVGVSLPRRAYPATAVFAPTGDGTWTGMVRRLHTTTGPLTFHDEDEKRCLELGVFRACRSL